MNDQPIKLRQLSSIHDINVAVQQLLNGSAYKEVCDLMCRQFIHISSADDLENASFDLYLLAAKYNSRVFFESVPSVSSVVNAVKNYWFVISYRNFREHHRGDVLCSMLAQDIADEISIVLWRVQTYNSNIDVRQIILDICFNDTDLNQKVCDGMELLRVSNRMVD